MHYKSIVPWVLGLLLLSTTGVRAADESAEDRGKAIMEEALQRDTGWGDWSADLTMTLRNKNGDAVERRITASFLEVPDDGAKSLIVFQEPADVKGSALLTHAHPGKGDDQWLYLPAVGRAKRIASVNKSGPFMGSEFAYEDLAAPDLLDFTYAFVREETVDGQAAFVIERVPTDKNSGYTRQLVWLDTEHFRLLKAEFYDRKDVLAKTLTATDYAQYADRYWRAGTMEMTNVQTGRVTTLTWSNVVFGQGMSDRDFDQSALRRAG